MLVPDLACVTFVSDHQAIVSAVAEKIDEVGVTVLSPVAEWVGTLSHIIVGWSGIR